MKGIAMKMPTGKSLILIGAALFVLGTTAGSLVVYRIETRVRSVPVPVNPSASSQQAAPQAAAPMADMPGMPGTSAQQPKAQDSAPMGDMAGMGAQSLKAPASAPAGNMADMPGTNASDATSVQKMAPGTVMLSPATQQLIGVRYTEAHRADLKRTLRTVGTVQMDEEKISRVHVKISGWIDKVYLDYVGKLIKKGQPLFTLYSPDLVATEQEYLIARKGQEYLSKVPYADAASGANSLLSATRDRLKLWDITDAQIRALDESGKAERTTTLYSPISGFVMSRNAYEQAYVTPETALYEIADLSTVWVSVDIYEYEAPYVHMGQPASMQLSYIPGKTYRGRVSYVYPILDPKTRTIKVRLEFPNPNYDLKPDMYADVQLGIDYGKQIVVPSEAVLNSGTRQVVFIAKPGGYFEPREIKVGDQFDGQYAVLAGLKPGEKIVASGNFLIDSESRLGAAMQGLMPGMDMSSSKTAKK
jgi:Cu(I)/Ag(I) efflux system membrane fusion protein